MTISETNRLVLLSNCIIIQSIPNMDLIVKHYKIKRFVSEAKKNDVNDEVLINIANQFLDMSDEARNQYSLGGGLFKLRLASKLGRGKSGGSRSILAFKNGKLIIWLHMYGKNEKGNVSQAELTDLKKLSSILLSATEEQFTTLVGNGKLQEITNV